MSELIVVENELVRIEFDPDKVFVHGGLDPLIEKISVAVDEEVKDLDPATDKGRKAYGSVCRKISSSSVFVETGMKNYVADLKAKIKPVDSERIRFVAAMKEIREKADQPRQEWLAKEQAKIDAANVIMKTLNNALVILSGTTSEELQERINSIEQINISDLPEDYHDTADKLHNDVIEKLYYEHAALIKSEKEQEELSKFRAEAAERAEADRKAKEEADRKASEERLKAEAAEAAKREAEEKAAEEIRKAKEAQEAAERREREAEAKRVADAEAAKAAAEKAKEEAERVEKERLAEIEKQRVAEEKRIANKKHRDKVKGESTRFIVGIKGVTLEQAEAIFDAIAYGDVPHISVNY